MRIIVLDTDVASRLQRGTVPLDDLSALKAGTAAITFVTVAEMFKGAFKAAWGPSRIGRLESWLAAWPVLPYDQRSHGFGEGSSPIVRPWAAPLLRTTPGLRPAVSPPTFHS